MVQTLKNAIKIGQIANAFLFCGIKGSGKTSLARLLAKTINCENRTPENEPCNACKACTENTSFHTHELDAASHNSAEDMRSLVDQIRFHPARGQKTVIIIDEAHMLSNAALNVLLKPLEDTPPHVVFILVTTEKHKIIPTVLSRCQVFDFHPLEKQAIFQQLQSVAQEESITYEEEALDLIAEQANGSMRDALSMFDLIGSFCGKKHIDYKAALHHLNLLDESTYLTLTDYLYQEQVGAALHAYDKIIRTGFDSYQFIVGFSQHLRNLLVAKNVDTLTLVKVPKKHVEAYIEQSKAIDTQFVYKALAIAQNATYTYKDTMHARLHVELMLIQLGQIPSQLSTKVEKKPLKTFPLETQQPAGVTKSKKMPYPILKETKPRMVAEPSIKPFQKQHTTNRTIRIPTSIEEVKKSVTTELDQKVSLPQTSDTQEPLSLALVQKHWLAYGQKMQQTGNVADSALFKQPIEVNKNQIIVELFHPMQRSSLDTLKPDLIRYLTNALSQSNLTITTKLTKPPLSNTSPKPYLDRDRLTSLCKENSHITYLQEALGLDTLS